MEQQRDQQAELATAAERARISRELHDVVAHGLSVMVVQAEGGQAALDNRPSDAGKALYAIAQVGRESLADMRRVLNTEADWHPQPGLAYLPRLIDQVRQAGMPVQLHINGDQVPLPSAVDLSGYRIVQESLTNTIKHAGADAEANVEIRYDEHELQIQVSDNGLGPRPPTHPGKGISGMTERVRLLGGSLTAGPHPAGGYVVQARLPKDGPIT
jgi:signal transduction histidine kinase